MDLLTLLEWTGAVAGALCVFLAARANILSWPCGLVSVTMYAVFFWQIKLYADAGLQLFYFGTGVVGWMHWARGGPGHAAAPIKRIGMTGRILIVAGTLAATGLLGFLLHRHTDASLPYGDSFTTCFSIVAQLLLMWKFYENWPLWVTVDIVAIGVYAMKEAWVTCGLYAVFLLLATGGWIAWHRRLAAEEAAT